VALLTETRLRSARPRERPYKLFDERGLFLLVTPAGGRLWRFRYKLSAIEKLISLGAYPDTTLKRAHEQRDDARKLKSCLYPYLGSRPIALLTAQELLFALRRIEARGRQDTAHRGRAVAGRVLRYAVATGRAQHDVAADLREALAPVRSKNFASVKDPIHVGQLLRAIDGYSGHPVTALRRVV
jgi:hypothetical protein